MKTLFYMDNFSLIGQIEGSWVEPHILIYMAGRFENNGLNTLNFKWHEMQVYENWEKIKSGTDFKMQRWP